MIEVPALLISRVPRTLSSDFDFQGQVGLRRRLCL